MRRKQIVVSLLVLGSAVASGQQPATVYDQEDGVTLPVAIKVVQPTYTPQARTAGIVGFVMVEAVVLATGTVADVKVVRSELRPSQGAQKFLTPDEVTKLGLDKQALNAAKRSTFKPGTKGGKPVAVRILIEMKFTPQVARGL